MPSYNRVILMGNLTRDPELRYTPSNTPVVRVGVAVNRRWRNQQGEQQEETTFVDCEGWSKQAEFINQYFRKGNPILIEGRLKLDQWQDKDGNNRSMLRVVIENVQFVAPRGAAEDGGAGPAAPPPARGAASRPSPARPAPGPANTAGPATAGAPSGPPPSINDPDIPF